MPKPFSASWEVWKEWLRTGECVAIVMHSNSTGEHGTVTRMAYLQLDGELLFMRAAVRLENADWEADHAPYAIYPAGIDKNGNPAAFLVTRPHDILLPWADVRRIWFGNPAVWRPWLNARCGS